MTGVPNLQQGLLPPQTLVVEKFSYPKSVFDPVCVCVEFQLSSSNSFQGMRVSQIHTRGCCAPETPPSGNVFISETCT